MPPFLKAAPQGLVDHYIVTGLPDVVGGVVAPDGSKYFKSDPDGSLKIDLASLPVGHYLVTVIAADLWSESATSSIAIDRPDGNFDTPVLSISEA